MPHSWADLSGFVKRRHQSRTKRVVDEFDPVANSQLFENIVHVSFDGGLGYREPCRDFRVAQAFCHFAHDFGLASGQLFSRCCLILLYQGSLHRGRHPNEFVGDGPDGHHESLDPQALCDDRARS